MITRVRRRGLDLFGAREPLLYREEILIATAASLTEAQWEALLQWGYDYFHANIDLYAGRRGHRPSQATLGARWVLRQALPHFQKSPLPATWEADLKAATVLRGRQRQIANVAPADRLYSRTLSLDIGNGSKERAERLGQGNLARGIRVAVLMGMREGWTVPRTHVLGNPDNPPVVHPLPAEDAAPESAPSSADTAWLDS